MAKSIYDFRAETISGTETPLADYKGKVMLIVNTASKCGFTPQFEGLENLHKKLVDKGLSILGFPCNQFGHQDPGSNGDIESPRSTLTAMAHIRYINTSRMKPPVFSAPNASSGTSPSFWSTRRVKSSNATRRRPSRKTLKRILLHCCSGHQHLPSASANVCASGDITALVRC
jgi:hypothetical protein